MRANTFKQFFTRRAGFRILVLVLVAAAAGLTAVAQQITGSIVGTVTDPQGAVVNTATVKATNTDTGFTRIGAGQWLSGEFRIDYLPVGNYTIEVTAAELQDSSCRRISSLTVDQTQTLACDIGSWHGIADSDGHRGSAAGEHKRCRAGQNDLAGRNHRPAPGEPQRVRDAFADAGRDVQQHEPAKQRKWHAEFRHRTAFNRRPGQRLD